jgi:excisionase family DNA binding protein
MTELAGAVSGRHEPLLTSKDVAALLGMDVEWVRRRTRACDIPHVQLGRSVRYRAADIQRYIAEHLEGT